VAKIITTLTVWTLYLSLMASYIRLKVAFNPIHHDCIPESTTKFYYSLEATLSPWGH